MKKIYKITAMLIVFVSTSIALSAQNFHVLDINDSKDSHPSNNSILFNQPLNDYLYGKFEYAVLNGIAYFTADDGIHGAELWRSDGTAEGTAIVKDIIPGSTSSNVSKITVSGTKIFFRADNEIYGQDLWVSDGTEAGTAMLTILPYSPASPSFLTDVNGTLYFFVNNYNTADQLWKTNGTNEGTAMVSDLLSEVGGYNASQLTNVNGHLFFVSDSYYDAAELYTNDGTPGSTHIVKDINPFGGSNPSQLTAVNGSLYFAADDETGKQLWVSDGTDANTYKVNNPHNIYVDDFYSVTFVIKNKTIYFSGKISDGDGSRLCAYNTSDVSKKVRVVKDINPGFFSSNLYNITNVNGMLFFTVFNGTDQVLWKSDGTTTGTMQVKDINPGGRNIYLYKDFVNAGGTLLFSFYDDANGYEVWKSDGTESGTVMVKDIYQGVYSSQAANITYIGNNTSFFEATNGKKGLELWKTDGTEAGTVLIKNINKSTTASSNPSMLTANADNSKLLFVADDPKFGRELRITDGTQEGTHVVKDLFKGSFSSYPSSLVNFNNETWFFADILDTTDHTTSDIRTINKLCKTNGTPAGAKIISAPALESVINGNGYVYATEASANLLYLLLYNYTNYSYELWRSDGTSAGTYPIKTNMLPYYNTYLKAVGNMLFFTNYDYNYGDELFVTNGTIAGTRIVKDIAPDYNSSYPSNLTSFNGKLYFTADYGYGPFVWSSDGSEAGTKEIKPSTIDYNVFAQAKGKLFFSGLRTVGKGNELYAIDENNNAYLVKDLYAGPGSSNIFNLTRGDTLIYFIATDSRHGSELWKSNGTKEGTKLIKTTPDFGNSYVDNMITVHNALFFTLNGGLWQTDGSANGAHIVDDVNLLDVTGLGNFKAFDNKLAFTGTASSTGQELYVGDAEELNLASSNTEGIAKIPTVINHTSVFPNPVKDILNIQTGGKAIISLTDQSGKIILTKSIYGNGLIDVSKLSAGIYYIKNMATGETQKIVVGK